MVSRSRRHIRTGALGTHEPTRAWADPGLREYQAAALSARELAGRRGLIALPTGSGKTRIALAAMAATRLPTLCLVPTRVLLAEDVSPSTRPGAGPFSTGESGHEYAGVDTPYSSE